jgi:glycerophosphoryl diester phosphodiesterase
VIAWTVDDAARIERLEALGVDGICTNDPRLFGRPRAG